MRIQGACAKIIAAIAVATGSTVVLRFAFGVPGDLPFVGDTPMGLDAAAAFILAGVALWLRLPTKRPVVASRLIARALSAGVAAIGCLAILDYLLGHAAGIHIFPSPGIGTLPASMEPAEGAAVLLLGLALLFEDVKVARNVWPTEILSALTFFIAITAFDAYLYGALELMPGTLRHPDQSMDPHTAIIVLLLATGSLCVRPERGVIMHLLSGRTNGAYLARRLTPLAVLGPQALGLLLEIGRREGLFTNAAQMSLFAILSVAGGLGGILLVAPSLERVDEERRRSLAALERSEARARGILDHAPSGIMLVSPDHQDSLCNDAMLDLVRGPIPTSPDDVCRLLRHPDGSAVDPNEAPSQRGLRGEVVRGQELLIVQPDGGYVPVLANAAPIRDSHGVVTAAVVTVQDIAAHKALERLQQEYVGLISHDLRSPLSVIALRASLIEEALRTKGLDAELRHVAPILKNVQRMKEMIQELLETAQLEAGRADLDRKPTNLTALVDGILDRDLDAEERRRFTVEVAEPPPAVAADPPRIERVVMNLFTNALKYSPPGSPIVVWLRTIGRFAVIGVHNEGAWIDPSDTIHLFEKFYRTRAGKKAQGFGLGLYICRLILEAHGGYIAVESTPGRGSTFSFGLPTAPAADLAAPAAAPRRAAPVEHAPPSTHA